MRTRDSNHRAAAWRQRYGPWGLITGAARGLGAAFAEQCARRGLKLVLVDREGAEVSAVADRLAATHGVTVRPVTADLAEADFMDRLQPDLRDLEVGLLVNNAALGPIQRFFTQSLALKLETLMVNCRAPLVLAHVLGSQMVARGRGGMVFVSSMSATQGAPLVAHYAATKAWNWILAEGLWAELRDAGVDVLALAPGPTETPAFAASGPARDSLAARLVMSTVPTAAEALDALGRTPSHVPGLFNRLSAQITTRLLPRRQAIELFARSLRGLYPGR
jgi:short-subunit dehydrogenase